MPRTYGLTNIAAWAVAPPVGLPGDIYYNLTDKTLYTSDGTQWNQIKGGGGAGGGPYVPVSTGPPVDPNNPVIAPPIGLLWVDSDDKPTWASVNFSYNQTLSAPTVASSPYTVTHNLATRNVQVQLWDSVSGLLVGAQVKVVDANNVQISVAQNMPNNINVVVVGVTGYPAPLNPGDLATKLYVDQRTPNLPPPVTSGATIQSFTDALGDVWVAQNGVRGGNWYRARDVLHAYWYRTTALNSPTASTVFLHDTVGGFVGSQDSYSLYNPATGTFNPPIAGWWQVYQQIAVAATASGQWLQSIFRNTTGAALGGGMAHASSATVIAATCSWRGELPAGYGIVTYVQASAALAVTANAYWTFMHIDYLGTG